MVSAALWQRRAIIMEQMNTRRPTAGKFNNNAAPPLLRSTAPGYFRSICLFILFLALEVIALLACSAAGQSQTALDKAPPAGTENAVALYRKLRSVRLDSSRIYQVRDAEFDLEDMHFALKEGTIGFLEPVAGHVTGAIFVGDGEVLLVPTDQGERASLALFTNAAAMEENFQTAYLRFFDEHLEKELEAYLRPADNAAAFSAQWAPIVKNLADTDALQLLASFTNLETANETGRFLHARVSSRQRGTFDLIFNTNAPEQINAGQVSYTGRGTFYDSWLSFVMRSKRQPPEAAEHSRQESLAIPKFKINVNVHPPESLDAVAQLSLTAKKAGLRTVIFELSRYLKVASITSGDKALEFIQNEALAGTELARRGNDVIAVVFPEALSQAKPVDVKFTYGGSVLSDAGGGLLRVGARGLWYPSVGLQMSDFELEFHCPREWTLLATGKQQSARTENGEQISQWKTERPIPLAGFNLGHYLPEHVQTGTVTVESYASRNVENSFPVRSDVIAPPQIPAWNHRQTPRPLSAIPATTVPTPSDLAFKVAQKSAKTLDYLSKRIGSFPYSSLALTQMP